MNEGELIAKSDGRIAVYNEFRHQLATLKQENEKCVFDYESSKGNREARSHVYKLRQTKSAVDKVRIREKAASLEYGRRVDSEAKEIASEIDAMIEVHLAPLTVIEQREKDRVERLQKNLDEITTAGPYCLEHWMTLPLEVINDRLAEVEAVKITKEIWEEFTASAAQAKDESIRLMREAIAKREKYDSEQAELERLRKESNERARKDREEQIRREAEQRALAAAEAKAKEEKKRTEEKAKSEREAAARRELELKLSAERAEREKVEAQQKAERAAKETEERIRREAEEAKRKEEAATAKREADKKHRSKINNAAMAAFVSGGLSEKDAKTAVVLIASHKIPRITIDY